MIWHNLLYIPVERETLFRVSLGRPYAKYLEKWIQFETVTGILRVHELLLLLPRYKNGDGKRCWETLTGFQNCQSAKATAMRKEIDFLPGEVPEVAAPCESQHLFVVCSIVTLVMAAPPAVGFVTLQYVVKGRENLFC